MVGGGVAAGDDRDVGVEHVAVRRRHRAGPDALEQRGHARGVAQPGAVVDVVVAEAGAHQLLEQVRLLVGALRRAEPRERAVPCSARMPLSRSATRSSASSQVASRKCGSTSSYGTSPPGLRRRAGRSLRRRPWSARRVRPSGQRALGVCGVDPDQRRREALRRGGVVPAVAALDAQPAL